jgi:hypothetical protein
MVTFTNMADVATKRPRLEAAIREWTEKMDAGVSPTR